MVVWVLPEIKANFESTSSRLDTGLVHEVQLISAERESETEGKGGLES